MILFKITNVKNNKIYINYKNDLPINLNRLKNINLKNDIIKFGNSNFLIDILYQSKNKEDIKKLFNDLIKQELKTNTLLYNKLSIGKIIVKDNNGKNIKINVTDNRYLSGELKHVSKGKIVVINIETNEYCTIIYKFRPLL